MLRIKNLYNLLSDTYKKKLRSFGIVWLIKFCISFLRYGLANKIILKNLHNIQITFEEDDTFEFRVNYLPDILNNTFENQTIKLFERVINKKDTIIDCGSNFGLFSLLACHLTGPNGKVYAFDASKKTCASLNKSKELNNFKQLVINHYALSNASKQKINFYGNSGGGTIIKNNPLYNNVDSFETVETISLDDYFEGKQIENLKLIKIDVEGSEFFVLSGMKKLIKNNPNAVITFELTKRSMTAAGYSIHDIVKELEDLNMNNIYDITNLYLIKKISFDKMISLFENNEIGSFTKDNGLLVELLVMNDKTQSTYKFM